MVRLEEIPTPLSSSLPSLRQSNGRKPSSLPSLHTFPSQMHTFPSVPNLGLPSSHVPSSHVPSSHVLNIPSADGGRENHKKKKKLGDNMGSWNSDARDDEEHGRKPPQGVGLKMNQAPPGGERRLSRLANRRREVTCLTVGWCHQQPFGREVAREVRRLYGITREVPVVGWLLAGGELCGRAMLWLLFQLPVPTVLHNLFRLLDEATCSGLQWVETTRQAARRGDRCPAWWRVVRALVAAGVAPLAVLWRRWHSRQQRLFLQEAGVLCLSSEDSHWGILGTTADILWEIIVEMSAAFLGRAKSEQYHPPAVAQEPALDTVAEDDEEGYYGDDDEVEDTIPLWELCWADDEVVMARKTEYLPNDEIKINISNDIDTLHDSNSNKKLTSDKAVGDEYSGTTNMEDARRLLPQHRRNYNNETNEALTSSGGLLPTWLSTSPPLVFSQHMSSLALPLPSAVEGSTFPYRGQDPAWEILLHLYFSLFKMFFIIPMLLMTVMRSDQHREANNQRFSSSVRPQYTHAGDEGKRSSWLESDERCGGQWNDPQPRQLWKKTSKSDQKTRPNLTSSGSDEVWKKETLGNDPNRSSDEDANEPIKRRVVTGGKKNRHSNSEKVFQETLDFIEPGLSDYEEEMWLQLGITPHESKKEDEEIVIKQTREVDFEACLNEENEENVKVIPDLNCPDETDILHNRDNFPFENNFRSNENSSGQCASHMSEEFTDLNIAGTSLSEKNVSTKLSRQFNIGRGSDLDASAQNSEFESKKPTLTRSFTYILRTKSDNLDSYSIPEASINLSSKNYMKAVKDQTNCKTRTELFIADSGSKMLSSDFKNTSYVTNRSTLSKTAPTKAIQCAAKIAKPITGKLRTKLSSSSGINVPQKLHENLSRRTDNSLHKRSPHKPIAKFNTPTQKTTASETPEKNIICSSGLQPSGVSVPIFKAHSLSNQSRSPAPTRMNGSRADKKQMLKLNKQMVLNNNHSPDSQIQSCVEQQKDHNPWRSCCMNSRNLHKDACRASSKEKNHEKAQ